MTVTGRGLAAPQRGRGQPSPSFIPSRDRPEAARGAQAKPSTERVRIEGRRPALDRRNINTLWQSRGEVEHIPPDCLPGEGALPVNLTSSGNPANDQRVTPCHVLPILGEAHTGSSSVQGAKGSGGPLGFQDTTTGRNMLPTVPVKVKPEGSRQRERAGQLKTRKGQI